MSLIKIGFVLASNSRAPLPSTRISVLNVLPLLRDAGFDPHIVFEPDVGTQQPELPGLSPRLLDEGFEIVYFQKVGGPRVVELVHQLSAKGIATVFGVCDVVDAAMARAADATVVVTEYLKSLYPTPLHAKLHVVHDGIENPSACKPEWKQHRGTAATPLRAVLVTSSALSHLPMIGKPPSWLHVSIIGPYSPQSHPLRRIKEVRWAWLEQRRDERRGYLEFLLDRRIRRIAWDPVDVYQQLQAADVGIIPVDSVDEPPSTGPVPNWMIKSENRLTLKMSVGLPVVASPVPAYRSVVEQGVNGYLAASPSEWLDCLDALRDPATRRQIGERARESVHERYSLRGQAQLLIAVLKGLRNSHNGIDRSREVA